MESKEEKEEIIKAINSKEKEISKNQLKKMKKLQNLVELNKELRKKAKEKRKEKMKKEKDEMKSKLNFMNQEERKSFFDEIKNKELMIQKNLLSGLETGIKIIFDLDYVEFMNFKEIKSVAHQLSISYSLNKTAKKPFSYHLCGYKNQIKEELEKMGSKFWHVNLREKFFYEDEFFQGKNLIYLSPDSEDVLKEINENEVYIIGGYVDKPVSKYKSLQKAEKYELRTKRLPIDEYCDKTKNNVLNINTVLEIISDYLETGCWETSINKAMPKRKFREN